MPDTKRLPYPETSESYHLYLNDKSESKTYESDEILIQSNIVNNANGSAFIEYNDAKVIVTCIGPKDIARREDFSLDGCLKVDLSYCAFSKPGGRRMPGKQTSEIKEQARIIEEALSSVLILQRYPKSQIDLCCQVLQEGASETTTVAAVVSACGLAAADAGLEMFGLVVGAATKNTFVSIMPELNQVTGMLSVAYDGQIDEDIKKAIQKAKSLYPIVSDFFNDKAEAKESSNTAT